MWSLHRTPRSCAQARPECPSASAQACGGGPGPCSLRQSLGCKPGRPAHPSEVSSPAKGASSLVRVTQRGAAGTVTAERLGGKRSGGLVVPKPRSPGGVRRTSLLPSLSVARLSRLRGGTGVLGRKVGVLFCLGLAYGARQGQPSPCPGKSHLLLRPNQLLWSLSLPASWAPLRVPPCTCCSSGPHPLAGA